MYLLLLCTVLNATTWCMHEDVEFGFCRDPVFSSRRYRINDCRVACKKIIDTSAVSYYLRHNECKIVDEHLIACVSNETSVGRFMVSIAVLKTLRPSRLKHEVVVIWRVGNVRYLDPRRGPEFDSMLDVVMECKKGKSMFHFSNDCQIK